MMTKSIVCIGLALVLPGCLGSGDDSGADSTLEFDGNGNGSHSDTSTCDDQGTIKGSGDVPDGDVLITLKDSAGKQLVQQTFKGTFTLAERTVSGSSGTWTIQAQRGSDDVLGDEFSGDYEFFVTC